MATLATQTRDTREPWQKDTPVPLGGTSPLSQCPVLPERRIAAL